MIRDPHNRDCACFKCEPLKKFKVRVGDVLTGIDPESDHAKLWGDLKIIGLTQCGRVAYTRQDKAGRSFESVLKEYKWISISADTFEKVDTWTESCMFTVFKLKK